MPTLGDLLKLKHLLYQTTKVDVRGTLLAVVGECSNIETLEQLTRRRLSGLDLNIIRELYNSIRRIERADMAAYEASMWQRKFQKPYVPMSSEVM